MAPIPNVLAIHLTSHSRSYQSYRPKRFLIVPRRGDAQRVDVEANGISRFSRLKFPGMLWFYDSTPCPLMTHNSTIKRVVFTVTCQGRPTKVRMPEFNMPSLPAQAIEERTGEPP